MRVTITGRPTNHPSALGVSPSAARAWAMRRLTDEAAARGELIARAKAAVAGCTVEAYAARIGELLARLVAARRLWGE